MRIYDFRSKASSLSSSKRLKRFKGFRAKLPKRGTVFKWVFRLAAAGIVVLAIMFIYFGTQLPNPNELLARNVPESTKIYDRNGELLYEVHGEVKRTLVDLDKVTPDLQHATIAVEDKDFYHHKGISIRGIVRSAWSDLVSGKKNQGGSTITQQFVKNAILTNEKSWTRKIKEAILSIEIEAKFSKADILKLYLNEIPYGRNAYGVEAASETYFGKHASELSLAESAYLAALPQAPTYYSPFGPNKDALDNRKDTILRLMKDQSYITDAQYQEAKDAKVTFSDLKSGIEAPHFVFYVEDLLADKYGEKTLEEGGLKIYTTLDIKVQKIAEEAVSTGVDKNSKKYGANNAAAVVIDPKTGQILAMVGSKDYFGDPEPAGCTPGKNCLFEPNVNVATSPRQPGSSFKPYVYGTAFKKDFGYSPASPLVDVVTNFGSFAGKDYIPHNYNGAENGPVSMRKALAGSLNVPAVKTLALVGVDNATQTAHDLGITTPLQNCGLSLVLGGCEVKLVDHVAAYAAIANEGDRHDKTAIMKIIDRDGKTLEEYQDQHEQVLDAQAAYELIGIMTDNVSRAFIFGASSPLAFSDRPVGCKTGTTQKWHDGWTLCYTPSLAVGVWAGNNDGTLLHAGADGVLVAAPITHQILAETLKGTPAEQFNVPNGITKVTVDSLSGKLPSQYSTDTKTETFADYSVPKDYDDVHVPIKIDITTGQPATNLTPPEQIVEQVFTVLHSEKRDNPNWENPVVAWAIAHGYIYPNSGVPFVPPGDTPGDGPDLNIISPADNAQITTLPFDVSVAASSGDGVARVDLSVDGSRVDSKTSGPFVFSVNQKFPDGQHILSVHAVDMKGKASDLSVTVQFALDQPLSMTSPNNNEVLSFPTTLTAESPDQYTTVSFYYQSGSTTPKLIGNANTISHLGNNYQYNMSWAGSKLKAGTYKLFAKTDTGISTPKITISIP